VFAPALPVLLLLGARCVGDDRYSGHRGDSNCDDRRVPARDGLVAVVVIDEVTVPRRPTTRWSGFYLVDDSTRTFDLLDLQGGPPLWLPGMYRPES
jgi:hypothetical protein